MNGNDLTTRVHARRLGLAADATPEEIAEREAYSSHLEYAIYSDAPAEATTEEISERRRAFALKLWAFKNGLPESATRSEVEVQERRIAMKIYMLRHTPLVHSPGKSLEDHEVDILRKTEALGIGLEANATPEEIAERREEISKAEWAAARCLPVDSSEPNTPRTYKDISRQIQALLFGLPQHSSEDTVDDILTRIDIEELDRELGVETDFEELDRLLDRKNES